MPSSAATCIPQCIISKGKGVSDMLEVALLLKEVGLVHPAGRSAINIVPLFETIEDLRHPAASWTACCRCPTIASWSTAAARCRR